MKNTKPGVSPLASKSPAKNTTPDKSQGNKSKPKSPAKKGGKGKK